MSWMTKGAWKTTGPERPAFSTETYRRSVITPTRVAPQGLQYGNNTVIGSGPFHSAAGKLVVTKHETVLYAYTEGS